MSFPSNPSNGEETIQNGIIYVYNTSTNSWKRESSSIIDQMRVAGTATFMQSVVYENTLLTTVVTEVTTTNLTLVAEYPTAFYRGSRSLAQVEDPGVNYQLSELVVTIDESGTVYQSESGVINTSGSPSGDFVSTFSGSTIQIFFEATNPSVKYVSVATTALPRLDSSGIG